LGTRAVRGQINLQTQIRYGMSTGPMHTKDSDANTTFPWTILNPHWFERQNRGGQVVGIVPEKSKGTGVLFHQTNAALPNGVPPSSRLNAFDDLLLLRAPFDR